MLLSVFVFTEAYFVFAVQHESAGRAVERLPSVRQRCRADDRRSDAAHALLTVRLARRVSPHAGSLGLTVKIRETGKTNYENLVQRGGESRGFGFVAYTTAEDAERALMLGHHLAGARLKLERCAKVEVR